MRGKEPTLPPYLSSWGLRPQAPGTASRNKISQAVGLMASVLAMMLLASCAHWQADSTAGYEATGRVIAGIGSQAKSMCAANAISPANCAVLKADYNAARAAYIAGGDALIAAINASDDVTKQDDLAGYTKALSALGAALPALVNAADACGIKTGGAK